LAALPLIGLMLFPLMGCGAFLKSFRSVPGQRISLPVKELSASGMTVTVQLIEGSNWRPYCGLPDAANEINCEFGMAWFQEGEGRLLAGGDGYFYLDPQVARDACAIGMFSAHGTNADIQACSIALLYYRFVVAPPAPTETT